MSRAAVRVDASLYPPSQTVARLCGQWSPARSPLRQVKQLPAGVFALAPLR